MIPWLNLASMIVAALLCLHFYVKSAAPAALAQKTGEAAYRRCTLYRAVASIFMTLAAINYVVYYFYPVPTALPRTFPWEWWGSLLIAVFIAVPGGYLLARGMKDAGRETMQVRKEHTLFRGIYATMRHPQAAGEITLWWVIAFVLNSPFLALFSFVWVPVFYLMCLAEERDLAKRYGQAYVDYVKNTGFVIPRR